MTRAAADLTPHIAAVAGATTTLTRLAAIDRAMAATVGHKLFTVLVINWDKRENQRYYSNQPDAYAVGGAKPIVRTMPGLDLLLAGKPRFLNDYAAIAAVFFDHELIRSLGCESCVNIPVHWNGTTIGMVNILHDAHWYSPADIPAFTSFAALAVPALRDIIDAW